MRFIVTAEGCGDPQQRFSPGTCSYPANMSGELRCVKRILSTEAVRLSSVPGDGKAYILTGLQDPVHLRKALYTL